jgi:hypothetical protein
MAATIITSLDEERAPLAAQILPPFAEKEYIDNRRAQAILGVSRAGIHRMLAMGFIASINYGAHTVKRINYHSVVSYCDHLRRRHHIPDRRPPLSEPCLRHRDCDLLPFPLADTISFQEAMRALGFIHYDGLVGRIEMGCFEAYQIVPQAKWRISRSSLQLFIEQSKHRAGPLPTYPHF